jgi:SAM-dependent methyltransferase
MDKHYYNEYFKLEREHWWFKARLSILDEIVRIFVSNNTTKSILNVGAATGATSIMLRKHGIVKSLEFDKECSIFLSEILQEKVLNASMTEIPLDNNSLDVLCAFDVIEHIDDHQLALQESHRVLKENGQIFITVPAFNFLWSRHDEINHHIRRYRLRELNALLRNNGFTINYATYFNSILFIPIFLIRAFSKIIPTRKNQKGTGSDFEKFNSSGFFNNLLYFIFKCELHLLKRKYKMPWGVSILIIAKKNKIVSTA